MEILWNHQPIIIIQRWFGDSWSWFFEAVTQLGSGTTVALIFALAFWINGRRFAYSLLGAVVVLQIINVLIWSIFYVPRPQHPDIFVYKQLDISSFPSGHTGTAIVLWGNLTTFGYMPAAVTVCIVLLVMLSRLYLGVHYLADLLGGTVTGLIMLVVYQRLLPLLVHFFSGRTFKFLLILCLSIPLVVFPFADSFPEGWEVFGAAVGAAIGVPLEYWYIRYHPINISRRKQMLKIAIGLGVLMALIAVSRLISSSEFPRDLITFALVGLWITFLAPGLFTRMGLSINLGDRLQ
ncbi:phosphatase PAP2 family protein [Komarekiella delphini-convector]|nr:phosphatase PAP2 family protein [Komarekiella delphini-convector]